MFQRMICRFHFWRGLVGLALSMLPLVDAAAQQPWEQYLDMLPDVSDEETMGWESVYETLSELSLHPIDINQAGREELEQLPFLSATDIENICAYVYRHGPLKSLGELAMMEGIDYVKRRLLACFLVVGDGDTTEHASWRQMVRHGHSDLLATATVPFYERRGDDNGYLGYPYKHSLRYSFHSGEQLKAGIVASQDAGEPFFAQKNELGYDFYSFYVVVKNQGRLKTLALGKYRANIGKGLVMNNDFYLGKTAAIDALSRNASLFRGHSSTMAANYLQGAAVTFALSRSTELSAFVSYRPIDGTLNADSTVATIVDDGYHRTLHELQRKNNTHQFAAGAHGQYAHHGFRVGATFMYTSLSRSLQPDTRAVYRRYYPSGEDFWNASIDYGYASPRFSVSGETATGDGGAIATLNTLSVKVSDEVTLTALQRFYGKRYHSLFAQSYSEGGRVQNESGVYAGVKWKPSNSFLLAFYSDFAYFAWPRYQVSQSSHASDNVLTASWTSGAWTLAGRYRLRLRQQDDGEGTLRNKTEQRGRLSVGYEHGRITATTRLDGVGSVFKEHSRGWMLSEEVRYDIAKVVAVDLSAGYFHTDDYNSRVYAYERGLLYTFHFPVFYGEGMRWTCMVRAKVGNNLMMTARLACTNYFDRASIGTGYQRIDHSSMTNLELQVRWKF